MGQSSHDSSGVGLVSSGKEVESKSRFLFFFSEKKYRMCIMPCSLISQADFPAICSVECAGQRGGKEEGEPAVG